MAGFLRRFLNFFKSSGSKLEQQKRSSISETQEEEDSSQKGDFEIENSQGASTLEGPGSLDFQGKDHISEQTQNKESELESSGDETPSDEEKEDSSSEKKPISDNDGGLAREANQERSLQQDGPHRRIIKRNKNATPAVPQKIPVYIGIDFGTTFTKVSFSFDGTNHFPVTFLAVDDSLFDATDRTPQSDKPYFRPSVLFYDERTKTLSYSHRTGVAVRYFKYWLLNPAWWGRQLRDYSGKDEALICSVYFLGCLLSEVQLFIGKQTGIPSDDLEYHVNMGVPFDNFNQEDERFHRYDQALNVGFLLSQYMSGDMSVAQIRDFIDTAGAVQNPNLRTIPELYAEILYVQEDPRFGEAFYMVVDVGGGTLDIALFEKKKDYMGTSCGACIAHEVLMLGVDALVQRIACVGHAKEARKALVEGNSYNPRFIDQEERKKAESAFFKGYGAACVQKAYHIFGEAIKSQSCLNCFILGGGRDILWYRRLMETQGRDMEMAGIPRTEIKTLQTYLQETKVNDRLVIAQKLATDPDSIPPLTGFPWNFQVPIQKTISPDVDAKLRQIIEDRYGV